MSEAGSLPVDAREFTCGAGLRLGRNCAIGGINGPARKVSIGQQVSIGEGVHIAAPEIHIGDYVTIHRHTTIYGYEAVSIGACSWVGQNAVLNCTAQLTIGQGCVISAYSSLWTHFAGGDVLEGCRYDEAAPVSVGDDAWLGVNATIAPVAIGAQALVLAGAVLTKPAPDNTVWGGNPATDLTAKLGPPFVETGAEDKYRLLCELLRRHSAGVDIKLGRLPRPADCPPTPGPAFSAGGVTVLCDGDPLAHEGSVFDVRDRSYSRTGSAEEVAFMRALLYRVKFYPR